MSFTSVELHTGWLGAVAERAWYVESPGASGTEVRLPTRGPQIVIGMDPERPIAIVHGPTTTARVIDRACQRRAVGLVLRPGGLRALTGVSATEFVDTEVDLDQCLPGDAAGFVEQLRSAESAEQVMSGLLRRGSHLGHQWVAPSASVAVVAERVLRGQQVQEACEGVGVSHRRLVANFRSEVGLLPKEFARLGRFESAVALVRRAGALPLAEIAVSAGYADQSHMTREFARFCAMSPGALHRDASNAPNHVAHA